MDSTSPGSAPAVRKHVRHVGHTCTLGQYWPEKETTSWPNSGEIRSNCWKHVIDIVVVDVGGGRAGGSEGCDGGRFAAVLSPVAGTAHTSVSRILYHLPRRRSPPRALPPAVYDRSTPRLSPIERGQASNQQARAALRGRSDTIYLVRIGNAVRSWTAD